MDGLPWPTITAAGGGWFLFGICMFGFVTGKWWVSRRENDAAIERAESAERRADKLAEQNAALVSWAELGKSTFTALRGHLDEERA